MSTQYYLKNELFEISNKDYLCDYSKIKSQKIDMTLSGKFLGHYPKIPINQSYFDKYPMHIDSIELEKIIKEKYNVDFEIVLGNGANGILQNLVKLFFRNSGNIVTPYFTFDQVEYAVTSFGGYTKRVFTSNYEINLDSMKKSIDKDTKMVYICNPNNPTGKYINADLIIKLARDVSIPVVIDESGIEIAGKKSLLDYKHLPKNLIIIRSFSKVYGLANFRMGFMFCSTKIKKLYEKNITTNEYSGISCLIAQKMLIDGTKGVEENIINIVKERNYLFMALKETGIDCVDSSNNLLLTTTVFKKSILNELSKYNVSVVPIYDRNNNLHIRIAVQDKTTNRLFIDTFKKIIADKKYILGIYKD